MSRTFAQRAVDLFPSPSIPRSCCIQITRLTLAKPLEKRDSLSFFIGLQANSRRPQARGDEICISALEKEFAQNISFEYQHFTKNRPNILYISLQKKRRYRTAAVPGYKTLARGQINLDEVIQLPPSKPFSIKLFKTDNMSKDIKHHEIGSLEISEVSSLPTEDDSAHFPNSESSDDEEATSDARKLNKNALSMASRVKSVVLSKILERVIRKNPHINPEDIDIDQVETMDLSELQLYDDLDDLGVSSDEEEIFADNISIASTPRPSLQPYFDSASQCSLQARNSIGAYSSGRRSGSYPSTMPKVEEEQKKTKHESSAQDEDLSEIKRPRARGSITCDESPGKIHETKERLREAIKNEKPILIIVQSSSRDSLIQKLSTITTSFSIIDVAHHTLHLIFDALLQVLHEINLETVTIGKVKVCINGSFVAINFVVKVYLDKISKKLNNNLLTFFFIPTDEVCKNHLTTKVGELCPIYRKRFLDGDFESNDLNVIGEKLAEIASGASHVAYLPVSEAILSLSDQNGDGHQIVPFCVELAVLETEDDSDSDDGRFMTSPTSSPFTSTPGYGNQHSEKLHVIVDYWLDDKQTKHSIKETLKTLEFQPQKNSILMKFMIRRRMRPNLPGLKKRDNDCSGRERRELVSRIVFKPREKSVTAKVSIDGQEFENISFFQIKPTQTRFLPLSIFTPPQELNAL